MSDFLRALGYDPRLYWLLAGSAVAWWMASALWPGREGDRSLRRAHTPLAFVALLLVAMFACRWPGIFHYRPVNPDEAQFLAGAITMLARHEFWWTDGTTSGPLVMLPLALPGLLGLPIDFASGRLTGLLLHWGTVVCAYLALRHVYGDSSARRLVLPLAAFFVCLLFWDFLPYSSECVPLFLCALAVWLLVTAFAADGTLTNRFRLGACGVVLGMLPFSKFQVLPLGAAIGIAGLIWIVRQPARDRLIRDSGRLIRDSGRLVGGVAASALLFFASLQLSGQWADEFASYFQHNLHYTGARAVAWSSSGYLLGYLTEISWGFASFHVGLLVLLIATCLGLRGAPWRPVLLGWFLVLAAYAAVLIPGRLYPHYLLFLTLPLGLLVGLQAGHHTARLAGRHLALFAGFFLLVGVLPQLADRAWDRHDVSRLQPQPNARAKAVGFINRLKQRGDSLAVWGWRPELYIETQLPQATRESLTEAQITPHPQIEYYRARFLADLQANRPAFFVDVIGPEDFLLHDVATQGHETFPALRDYIAREYKLVSKAEPVRVYVRRAAFPE